MGIMMLGGRFFMKIQAFLLMGILILTVFTSGCTDSGDQKNLTYDKYKNEILPKIIEYNNSKGTDNPKIPIHGEPLLIANLKEPVFCNWINITRSGNDTANQTVNYIFFNQSNATLFVIVNQQQKVLESGTYNQYINGMSMGQVQVDSSQLITDIVVIYYPSLEIAGWHRVYGGIPEHLKSSYNDSSGPYGGSNIRKWITSLPGFKEVNNTNSFDPFYTTTKAPWDNTSYVFD